MKLFLIPAALVRLVRAIIGEDETRLREIDRHDLDDPHADEQFLVRDGKPLTFREFNAEMSERYARQPEAPVASPRMNAARRFD